MSIKKFYTGVYVGDNLGVGTTSPSEKLEVAGNLKLNSGALIISGTPAGQGAQTRYISGVATTNDLWFNVPTAGRYRFAVADSQIVEITSAGNVGIGTNSPAEKLHAVGNVKAEQTTNTSAYLTLNPNSSALGTSYQWNLAGTNSAASYAFQVREGVTPYLHINNSAGGNGGNVGIGTTDPKAKLDVAGGVRVANDTDTASADKEGTLRYRLAPDVPKSQSMVDMCMKTGPSSYSWVNIVTNTWNN
jgi:hypothetical protein